LVINPAPLVIAPASLPIGAVGISYTSTTISASGGTGAYIMTSAGLPAGLVFNPATGVLNGTPTAAGSGTITVKDSGTPVQSGTLTVTVNPALVLAPASLPNGAT